MTPACSSTAAEERTFTSQCASTIAKLSASQQRLRGRRALAITWVPGQAPWAPPVNLWGVGHLLLLAYRLHALCVELDRFCYVRLFDARLGSYFGYFPDGASWDARESELSKYAPSVALSIRCTAADVKNATRFLSGTVRDAVLGSGGDAALVRVTIAGWIPFEHLTSRYFEAVRSRPGELKPAAAYRLPNLDTCLCRYVTQPRVPLATLPFSSPRTAIHLRTGFADAEDEVLRLVAADRADAHSWLAAACDRAPGEPASLSGNDDYDPRSTVVSDAPGMLHELQRRYGTRVVTFGLTSTTALGGHARKPSSVITTRSWLSSYAAKKHTYDDIVRLGRAAVVHVSAQRRFRPPRSLPGRCTGRRAHLFANASLCAPLAPARPSSSFFMPALARSVCVERVGMSVPGCPRWADVFVRDLPSFMKLSQHQLSSMTSFNETIVAPAKGERTTYQAMRDALPAYHPCSRASIGECYRSFVAGMRA